MKILYKGTTLAMMSEGEFIVIPLWCLANHFECKDSNLNVEKFRGFPLEEKHF